MCEQYAFLYIGTMARILVSTSKSDLIDSAQIQLLGEEGVASFAELERCSLSWTGNVSLPSTGNYSYQLVAQDSHANQFAYHTHKTVEYQSGQEYYSLSYTGNVDIQVEVGERVELKFRLESTNLYGSTHFKLNAKMVDGFTCTTVPSEVTLLPGQFAEVKAVYFAASSSLEPGSKYTGALTASNGCTTLSASKNITIMVCTNLLLAIHIVMW